MDYIKIGSLLLVELLFFAVFFCPGYASHVKRNARVRSASYSYRSSAEEKENLMAKRKISKLKILNRKATKRLFDLNEYTAFRDDYLRHILRVRVPGTSGHHEVKNFIIETLEKYGWRIELDEFVSPTPIGKRKFTNIIAVLYPEADRRLLLAAHYDSKLIEPVNGQYFIGATDSAVPCAMLLDFAKLLADKSKEKGNQTFDVSPMIVFLDGEEAFVEWNKDDSIYGSRHLANYLATQPHHRRALAENNISQLDVLEAFVLFDLIGAKNPQFFDIYPSTSYMYGKLQYIERQLGSLGKINNQNTYFPGKPREYFEVEDDHEPFLEKGVPILHLIAVPFPSIWHQLGDNESVLDEDSIVNLLRIFRRFLLEYFDLL